MLSKSTNVGPLGSSAAPARISFTASFYDAADRDVADANVGTNNDTDAWSGPTTTEELPAGSQVTSYVYDNAGNVEFAKDPMGKSKGTGIFVDVGSAGRYRLPPCHDKRDLHPVVWSIM